MSKPRRIMTVRVVALGCAEAGDSRVGGTVAERLVLVARLSETSWRLTGRSLPHYTRATMPITVSSLSAQSERA